jgi:hypothetical protein
VTSNDAVAETPETLRPRIYYCANERSALDFLQESGIQMLFEGRFPWLWLTSTPLTFTDGNEFLVN